MTHKVRQNRHNTSPEQRLAHKKVHIFQSFEEAEKFADSMAAKKTPAERIAETVQLILRVYGTTQAELNARRKPLHIKIVRSE